MSLLMRDTVSCTVRMRLVVSSHSQPDDLDAGRRPGRAYSKRGVLVMPAQSHRIGPSLCRAIVLVTSVAALVLGLTACGSSSGGAASASSGSSSTATVARATVASATTGILQMGLASSPIDGLNVFDIADPADYNLMQAVYPALVNYNAQSQLVGDWAKSWKFAANGKAITFLLRPHEKWSDGTPLTSADALWMCDVILRHSQGAGALLSYLLAGVTSCSAPTPTTFVLHLSSPIAGALMPSLTSVYFVPEHIFAAHAGPNDASLKSYTPTLPLVAGGPYTVVSYQKDGTTILRRNPFYYGTAAKTQYVAWTFYGNTDEMVTAYNSGQLDAIYDLPATVAGTLRANKGDVVSQQPSATLLQMFVNVSTSETHKELLNVGVRRALSLAINRQRVNTDVFSGAAVPLNVPLPAVDSSYWTPQVRAVATSAGSPDIKAANALLDHLGYKRGANGIRVADGHPMAYTMLMLNTLPLSSRLGQIIQASWAAIGVKVTVDPVDFSTMSSEMAGPKYSASIQMVVNEGGTYPDSAVLPAEASSADIGSYNMGGYSNAKYNSLIEKEGSEVSQAGSTRMMAAIEKFFIANQPFIPIMGVDSVGAYHKPWKGFCFTCFDMNTWKGTFTRPAR
jgi:peptide/nickel transport system substrate-binding protein